MLNRAKISVECCPTCLPQKTKRFQVRGLMGDLSSAQKLALIMHCQNLTFMLFQFKYTVPVPAQRDLLAANKRMLQIVSHDSQLFEYLEKYCRNSPHKRFPVIFKYWDRGRSASCTKSRLRNGRRMYVMLGNQQALKLGLYICPHDKHDRQRRRNKRHNFT